MRTTPLIGTKAWFGPKRFLGWGWTPISIEGWIATLAAIGVVVGVSVAVRNPGVVVSVSAVAVLALIVVCLLKGTSPGGPNDARRGDDGER